MKNIEIDNAVRIAKLTLTTGTSPTDINAKALAHAVHAGALP